MKKWEYLTVYRNDVLNESDWRKEEIKYRRDGWMLKTVSLFNPNEKRTQLDFERYR